MTDDLISRQQAIDALYNIDEYNSRSVTVIKNLPSIQPEQRWIPVTERLPETSGYYLVTVNIGLKITDVVYFNRGSGFLLSNIVTAWKPYPEPYQGEGKQI